MALQNSGARAKCLGILALRRDERYYSYRRRVSPPFLQGGILETWPLQVRIGQVRVRIRRREKREA